MKIKINRNILWAEAFVNELVSLGVKFACLSPGSRNTSLTFAFSQNKKIKSFSVIDERSCGFFGLGIAKATNTPVVLVSTSGTATAEFYPAIIEAYQNNVPLIICTADRPPEMLNCGANQTINQDNIYRNHINWYFNVGLPEPTIKRLKNLRTIAKKAVFESMVKRKGPVHLNFPLRKPFEPFLITDEIDNSIIQFCKENKSINNIPNSSFRMSFSQKDIDELFRLFGSINKGIIIAGSDVLNPDFPELCNQLASILNYPIVADGISQLRFGHHNKENIITNFEGMLRTDNFINKIQPEMILQFGRTPTSKGLETFLENSKAVKYLINESGDWYDPANKASALIQMNPGEFCKLIIRKFGNELFQNQEKDWQTVYFEAEEKSLKLKSKIIDRAAFPFEGRIIPETIKLMPDDSVLMISNSMPVRDLDYFAPKTNKSIIIYNNRGASGIDGITSTALGIAATKKKPTVLVTGDLAFYYDLNGLLNSKKYKIPLVIILINNNGGGIFEMLPVSRYKNIFKEYFLTPLNLNFASIVKAYNGKFIDVKSWEHFKQNFLKAIKSSNLTVLQIKTNAKKSAAYREKYWNLVGNEITKM